MARIKWNDDGWTTLQKADAKKHIVEIVCQAKDSRVIEVRIRHNDGEEAKATVLYNGSPALPMTVQEFKEHFEKQELDIR